MRTDDPLQDVLIRKRQLENHFLNSAGYLRQAHIELKRQVSILYLAIALLILFQGIFAVRWHYALPLSIEGLTAITSLLAIVNCLLLIRTKNCLRRLNHAWLKPEEREVLSSLRQEHREIMLRIPARRAESRDASLN